MTVVLRARGLTVEAGGRRLLDGVTLDLHAGETLALVGPNGAGKSTLLSVLAGDRASAGSVELEGRALESWTAPQRARRRSVLTQSNEVSFPFTAIDVVRMGRAPWRRRAEAARDETAVAEALDAGEVATFSERPVTALSGGERARVSFARSVTQECRIALLDEPTASLDIRHQHRVLAKTRERTAAGGAAVVVLHDLVLAAAYADRIAVLDRGVIAAIGTPREVLDPVLLTKVYRHPVHVMEGPHGGLIVLPEPAGARPEPRAIPVQEQSS